MGTKLYIGGAIMSAASAAISSGFNAFNLKPDISWAWITFISIAIFIMLVFLGWNSEANRRKRLEDIRPNITVTTMETINDEWCLKVTNIGEKGNFEVQISILAVRLNGEWYTTTEFAPWKGVWASQNTNEIEIKKGHYESVKLVRVIVGISGRPILRLLGYDLNTNSVTIIKDFEPMNEDSPEIIVRLSIVISSHPSPVYGTFKKVYEITPFDMIEVNVSDPSWLRRKFLIRKVPSID